MHYESVTVVTHLHDVPGSRLQLLVVHGQQRQTAQSRTRPTTACVLQQEVMSPLMMGICRGLDKSCCD